MHLAASGGLSYRLRYNFLFVVSEQSCLKIENSVIVSNSGASKTEYRANKLPRSAPDHRSDVAVTTKTRFLATLAS